MYPFVQYLLLPIHSSIIYVVMYSFIYQLFILGIRTPSTLEHPTGTIIRAALVVKSSLLGLGSGAESGPCEVVRWS